MSTIKWRNEALWDVAKLALAAFLFAAPWIYRFAEVAAASRSAWINGAVIGIASACAIVVYSGWEEWVSLLAGLWVLLSPWLLGFHHTVLAAMRVDVTVESSLWSLRSPTCG